MADLEQVRQLLAEHPDWSRRRLSQHLATLWNWRNPMGQLKDMAARTLLLKLERRGWIVLPPRRQVPSNRMRPKPMPTPQELVGESPLLANLGTLLPLEISEVSPAAGTHQRALFENLLRRLACSLARRLGSVPTGMRISAGTPLRVAKVCI